MLWNVTSTIILIIYLDLEITVNQIFFLQYFDKRIILLCVVENLHLFNINISFPFHVIEKDRQLVTPESSV